MTMKTYVGQLERGRFIADSPSVKLPDTCRVIVNILDDEAMEAKTHSGAERQAKLVAFDQFIEDARKAENEQTEADWSELENIRSRTNAGMAREIGL